MTAPKRRAAFAGMSGGGPVGPASACSGSGRTWAWLSIGVGLLAMLAWPLPREAIDWQPARFASQPWRALTAAFVHLSGLHLAANLAGTLMVGLFGRVARVGLPSVAAWLVAWPATQVALLAQPRLLHYAGLSGVLHAGVAVVAVHLLWRGNGPGRLIGIGVLVGLAAKITLESPWSGPLRHPAGWDIAVAPLAHAGGALAGVVASLAAEGWTRRRTAPG